MAAESVGTESGLRRGWSVLASVGSVALAFLASQHHTLHMLVLSFGVGTAGMSFMTMYPNIRRGMLMIALVTAGFAAYQATRRGRPGWMRIGQAISATSALLLIIWSLVQFGL